ARQRVELCGVWAEPDERSVRVLSGQQPVHDSARILPADICGGIPVESDVREKIVKNKKGGGAGGWVGCGSLVRGGAGYAAFAILMAGCGARRVATAPAQAAVLVGAGDIADCTNLAGAQATAELLKKIPGTVMAIGDLAYPDGTPANFACYDQTWGQVKE